MNIKYRINKAIARLGICSRRNADILIKQNKVLLNSQEISDLNTQVKISDIITVLGKAYLFDNLELKLFSFYKPQKCITSSNDPQGRKTVFDIIPENHRKLFCIGRLDYNTEGLLLFTNDGKFARFMEHPCNNFKRRYRVRAFGRLNLDIYTKMQEISRRGIAIQNINYKPFKITLNNLNFEEKKKNFWFSLEIFEGKNREVRKIMAHFGFEVNRLIRQSFGPYEINDEILHQSTLQTCNLDSKLLEKFEKYSSYKTDMIVA